MMTLRHRAIKLFLDVENDVYTATSRGVVGKSVLDNSEKYCGWFLVHLVFKEI